jgi:hypothetical protein
MAEVLDLRGREAAAVPPPVLADPTGKRARMLARGGKVVAACFCLWFAGLALAGLGILPSGYVPLGSQLSAPATPPKSGPVRIAQPAPSDLVAAHPASSTTLSASAQRAAASGTAHGHAGAGAGAGAARGAHVGGSRSITHGAGGGVSHGKPHGGTGTGGGTVSGGRHGGGTTGGGTTTGGGAGGGTVRTHGKATAPGQVQKTATPGHTKTTPPGNSGSAPGHQTTTTTPTTTTPGNSGSAPGQTGLHGSGGAHGH